MISNLGPDWSCKIVRTDCINTGDERGNVKIADRIV